MSASPSPLDAVVIGGSLAGLLAAISLRRAGFDAHVFERSTADLESRGAGIVTHPELFTILARAGIRIEPGELGVTIPGRRILDRSGEIINEIDLPQELASWGRLYGLLKAAIPPEALHGGATFARVDEQGEAVSALFADGRTVSAKLLVAADGLFSTVRSQFLPQVEPSYAGYVAWRGLVEENALSPQTREAICNRFAFCLPAGEQMVGYPVLAPGEEETGRRRFNFVWYRPAAPDHLRELLTDIDGKLHSLSIPPNGIRPAVMNAMRSDAERLLAPPFAEVVRKTEEPFLQAILDLEVPTMCPRPRIAIIGDAAFVARPHVGAGVTKAAADADCLAQVLAKTQGRVSEALTLFDRQRRPLNAAIVARARELGAYMQAQVLSERERQYAEAHRRPEAVISETAVPPAVKQPIAG